MLNVLEANFYLEVVVGVTEGGINLCDCKQCTRLFECRRKK